MTRHEIDIEGLPEGWVPESINVTLHSWDASGNLKMCCGQIAMRRKVRKYDWSKTLDDVLVAKSPQHVVFGLLGHQPPDAGMVIAPIWQPNIHGKCPVDGEACIIRIRNALGFVGECLAKDAIFDFNHPHHVTAWQFIRLADGVEW